MVHHMAHEFVHNAFPLVLANNDNSNRPVYLSNFLQRMASANNDPLLPEKMKLKKKKQKLLNHYIMSI